MTKDRGRGIRAYHWAEDDRSLLYIQDTGGDENWRVYQVDLLEGSIRDLTPHPGAQAQLVGTSPELPDELLVALNVRDKRLHDVYRVSLRTGESRLDTENPGDVTGWLADSRLRVRACKAALPDGGSRLRARDDERAPWRDIVTWGPDDSGGAVSFAPGDRTLYVESSLGADTTRLLELDLAGATVRELARYAEVDVGPVVLHPRTYALQAVGFNADRLEWMVLDPAVADDFARLGASGEGDFQLLSRDDEDRQWVVLYNSDRKPPRYFLYRRDGLGGGSLDFLFSTRPAIERFALAEMRPVRFTASDGLRIRGYLTLPPGVEPRGLPMVLLVHGGPWVRDSWGWQPEAQWLSNRGFAVLQVNYRGSAGFGKAYLHAGDREWGARMQEDLTEAVRWAAGNGVADPARVAIFGGSYGGYAALAGAAFTPGVYACAVDIVGPSNLETLIRSIPPYWEPMRRIFDLRVGNVDTEAEFLRSRSPLFAADRIAIPLLIAQGANDPRVKVAESEAIVAALRAAGKSVEYVLFPDEGHGFARPENRLRFYRQAEEFLERHLGGRKATPEAPGPLDARLPAGEARDMT